MEPENSSASEAQVPSTIAKPMEDEVINHEDWINVAHYYSCIRSDRAQHSKRGIVRYHENFKKHLIQLWIEGNSIASIARTFGLRESTPRTWVEKKFGIMRDRAKETYLALLSQGAPKDLALDIVLNFHEPERFTKKRRHSLMDSSPSTSRSTSPLYSVKSEEILEEPLDLRTCIREVDPIGEPSHWSLPPRKRHRYSAGDASM